MLTIYLQKLKELINQYENIPYYLNKPSYLLVQMVRFYWKQGGDGKEGTKSKILRV